MELTNDFRVSAPPPKAWEALTDVERIAPMLPGAQLQEIEGDDFRGIVKVKVGPITAQYKGTASFQEKDEADGRVVLKASGRDTRGQGNASAIITATLVPDGDGTKVTVVTDLTVTGKVAQFGRGVLADVSSKLIRQFVDALEADLERGETPVGDAAPVVADLSVPGASAFAEQVAEGTAPVSDPAVAEPPTSEPPTSEPPTSEPAASEPADGDADPAAPPVGAGLPSSTPAASSDVSSAGAATPETDALDRAEGEPAPSRPTVRRIDSPEPEPVDLLDAAGGSVAKRLLPIVGGVVAVVAIVAIVRTRRRE